MLLARLPVLAVALAVLLVGMMLFVFAPRPTSRTHAPGAPHGAPGR
jgi:hypothetical protein